MTIEPRCAKCGGASPKESKVDERSMFECNSCSHIWYSNRGWTSGHLAIRDNIIEDIEKKGYSDQDYLVLLNTSFGQHKGLSCREHIKQWATLNKLRVLVDGDSVHFFR
jgi:hypothetical protein